MSARTAEESPSAHVLVVDDNRDNCELLQRRLQRKGYAVRVAMNGAAALDALAQQTFDAVLLDIHMPDMSGLQVLAAIRERFGKAELPVVMATAHQLSQLMGGEVTVASTPGTGSTFTLRLPLSPPDLRDPAGAKPPS